MSAAPTHTRRFVTRTAGGARFADLARRCADEDRGAFVPFLVIGDPSLDAFQDFADALVEAGADALELGLPFSDPPADGPVIQAADQRALAAGVTTASALDAVGALRARHDLPVSLLVYFNLVLQYGIDAFYARCAEVGVDAVLVADLPPEHAAPAVQAARLHGIAAVFLASELSPASRLGRIGEVCDGYVYSLARVGVTGERVAVNAGLGAALDRFATHLPLPLLVGFGISSPEHVRAALAAGADGVIVGSALVRRIAAHLDDPARARAALLTTARALRGATQGLHALRTSPPDTDPC